MRRIPLLLLAIVMLVVGQSPSEARRIRLPIIIPGLSSSSEQVVKVLDLPDVAELRRTDGSFIDLGYLFKKDGTGEWVGYVGTSDKYLTIPAERLPMLIQLAGLSELPPVPERGSAAGGGSWLLYAILAVALGWGGLNRWKARRARQIATRGTDSEGEGELSGWAARAGEQIAASGLAEGGAVTKARAPMPPREQSAPIQQQSRMPAPAARRGAITAGSIAVHSARPAFGRR